MENDAVKRYIYFIVMINFAISLISFTGIFPVQANSFNVFEDVNARITELSNKFTNASNTFEYMIVVASLIINGLILVFEFIFILIAGLPMVLYNIGVPLALCAIITSPILVMILYEIATKMLRSGA
ncbi:hypothetical protein [uncultured Methanomethylovorans sp.]|uniref:hypothetical protein n=1 Tax=uncultured Methanomethylovorans sp. TaxID=183759 RepID=UPI002AA8BC01|nr:hypothetical protein [uncultured Methanomethylovorans sp.]